MNLVVLQIIVDVVIVFEDDIEDMNQIGFLRIKKVHFRIFTHDQVVKNLVIVIYEVLVDVKIDMEDFGKDQNSEVKNFIERNFRRIVSIVHHLLIQTILIVIIVVHILIDKN